MKLGKLVEHGFRQLGIHKAPKLLPYFQDYLLFKKMAAETAERFPLRWQDCRPFLHDKTTKTTFDRHYIYHPAWAARILRKTSPPFHVDISSSLTFSSLVSAFLPVLFFDYRPADLRLSNLTSAGANLLALPFETQSISSLSCMHTIEHIGLGRYGDPLDPDGDLKAISELKRVLAPGGILLMVVPVGKPRLIFNAHRIYSCQQIIEYCTGLELREFTLVPDDGREGGLIAGATAEMADAQTYGCGCFWFTKT